MRGFLECEKTTNLSRKYGIYDLKIIQVVVLTFFYNICILVVYK